MHSVNLALFLVGTHLAPFVPELSVACHPINAVQIIPFTHHNLLAAILELVCQVAWQYTVVAASLLLRYCIVLWLGDSMSASKLV